MSRWQHIIPSGIIALISLWICWLSYTQEPAAAFLFPRLISSLLLLLALWTFGKAVIGWSRVGRGLNRNDVINMAPGLVVGGIYIFWAAEALGFYTAMALAVFVLISIYDPAPHNEMRSWIKRGLITIGCVAVMYALFALFLNVYTPSEVLFQ